MKLKELFKKFHKKDGHGPVKEKIAEPISDNILLLSEGLPSEEESMPEESLTEEDREKAAQEAEKERLTSQFRLWIDTFDHIADAVSQTESVEKETDLYALFSEFTVLKNEVKRQSRQVQSTLDEYRSTVDILRSGLETLQKEQETAEKDRQIVTQDIEKMALRMVIMEVLDIRDRIEESVRVLKKRKRPFLKRIFWIKDKLLPGIVEGQEMILSRMDRMLLAHSVTPIETHNRLLDPHIMRAIEVDTVADEEEGFVLEEIRKGFMLNSDILRVAEVKVNKHKGPGQNN